MIRILLFKNNFINKILALFIDDIIFKNDIK